MTFNVPSRRGDRGNLVHGAFLVHLTYLLTYLHFLSVSYYIQKQLTFTIFCCFLVQFESSSSSEICEKRFFDDQSKF